MANDLTTSVLANLVYKRYEKIWYNEWPRISRQYPAITKQIDMDNLTYLTHAISGFGSMSTKTEGTAATQDDVEQKYAMTLTAVAYAKYWLITKEMRDDDQYGKILQLPISAMNAANDARENACANIYNRAFNNSGSYDGPDSTSLCVDDHPLTTGTTENVLSSPATLEKASLRDAMIKMRQFVDHDSLPINKKPKTLLVPNELMFDAEELIRSPYNSEDDTNAITPKAQKGLKLEINDYLTDADAYFVLSDIQQIFFALRADVSKEVNPQTDSSRNIIYDVFQRFTTGWADWRDVVGMPGTS